MNKYRLKRIQRYNTDYNEDELDDRFVEGTINYFPEVGESLQFIFNRPDKGQWITSKIIGITDLKGNMVIETKNSTYSLKKGWYK